MNLILVLVSLYHPFHLSVTNIYHKPKEKVVQVEQRIFLDDFEEALRDFTEDENFYIKDVNDPQVKELLESYLNEHFYIELKGKKVDLQFLGSEIVKKENVMWCYFEAEKVKKFESFQVFNSLLVEKFSDQENIIHYTYPDGKKRSERTDLKTDLVSFD